MPVSMTGKTCGHAYAVVRQFLYFMIMLKAFKVEVMTSNKALTEHQATQYHNLKADLLVLNQKES